MKGFFGDFGAEGDLKTYTVQRGDSLSAISKKFYGDYSHVQEIADANGIDNPNLIQVGQVLELPGLREGTSFSSDPAKTEGSSDYIPYSRPITIGPVQPPAQSPVFLPPSAQPQPTPIPYTQPITLPTQPAPIPYTQPIALPALPSVPSTPAAPGSGFDFWSLLPKTSGKIFGIDKKKAIVGALGVIGLIMLATAKAKYATNPRRKKRKNPWYNHGGFIVRMTEAQAEEARRNGATSLRKATDEEADAEIMRSRRKRRRRR